jgi:Tol biopolymer transport system component
MSGNFVHPHPSFSMDDRYLLFASDFAGKDRGNIYLVDLNSKRSN